MTELRWLKLWHLVGAAMVVFIIVMTLTPNPIPMPGKWTDKLFHFAGYFGVMAWYAQFIKRRYIAVLFLVGLGVSLEFAQIMISTRSFEWADMSVNILGVIFAAVVVRGVLAKLLWFFEAQLSKNN